jgi:hypothetical protein
MRFKFVQETGITDTSGTNAGRPKSLVHPRRATKDTFLSGRSFGAVLRRPRVYSRRVPDFQLVFRYLFPVRSPFSHLISGLSCLPSSPFATFPQ